LDVWEGRAVVVKTVTIPLAHVHLLTHDVVFSKVVLKIYYRPKPKMVVNKGKRRRLALRRRHALIQTGVVGDALRANGG
jgi:hypothetical protein